MATIGRAWLRLQRFFGNDWSVQLGSAIDIRCEQFEPEMFVNLLIFKPKKDEEFTLCFLEDDDDNYTLNISPNYEQRTLRLQSKIEGQQHEESTELIMPEPGKPFHLNISAEENCFDIFIAKEKCYSYTYRSDVKKIKRIVYSGGHNKGSLSIGRRLSNWKPGAVVYIHATTPKCDTTSEENAKFGVDFASTYQPNYERDDLPLHISVRQDKKHVVFNSKANKSWMKEELVDEMPFTEDEDFSMAVCAAICAQRKYFEIGVNSEFFKRFDYANRPGQDTTPEQMSVQLRRVAHIKKIEYYPSL